MTASSQKLDREERLQKIGGKYAELLTEIDDVDERVTAALAKIAPAPSDD